MMQIHIRSKNKTEEKEDRKIVRIMREGVKLGADCKEEIYGYVMHRHYGKIRNAMKKEYAPAIRRLIPELFQEFDKRYEEGKEMHFAVVASEFMLEMGQGDRKFLDIGHVKVAGSIRKTLQSEGININCSTRYVGGDNEPIRYFVFKALSEEDASKIEEQDERNRRKVVCRNMARELCHHKVHSDDDDSIWNDTSFVKKIGGCAFDVEKIEDKVKKEKENLFAYKIRNGFDLMFVNFIL